MGISIHSLRMEGDQPLVSVGLDCNGISIHSLRMEGDILAISEIMASGNFNPLPPHGGRQQSLPAGSLASCYFNPLPPHGGRHQGQGPAETDTEFQSTPSAWRETTRSPAWQILTTFQSTPSAWRETSSWRRSRTRTSDFNPLPPHGGRLSGPVLFRKRKLKFQSTPSAWRETFVFHVFSSLSEISIHSLRMEGDSVSFCHNFVDKIFQSTPSAWRETSNTPMVDVPKQYFNPLPPHGGRLLLSPPLPLRYRISIHSLRMEGDSTRSTWDEHSPSISIHSLRMEGDLEEHAELVVKTKFQSTPSAWRETPSQILQHSRCPYFNPLPPHGGRLHKAFRHKRHFVISIHSLRMEGDIVLFSGGFCCRYFNPLPPHGGRPSFCASSAFERSISIHSLRMEGDSKTAQESVFHFAYPCTILQKRMQKTTFCTRKNGFFRKKGEKFGAKPSASFCAPMIRTDTFPLNFSHRISGSSMSMVSFAPICSTFD